MFTLGHSVVEPSWNNIGTDALQACGPYFAGASGPLDSISAYIDGNGGGVAGDTQKIKLALYADAASYPGALVAASSEGTVTFADAARWITLPASGLVTIGSLYWLAVFMSQGTPTPANYVARIAYLAANPPDLKYGSSTYASGVPDPYPAAFSTIGWTYCIYASVKNEVLGQPPMSHLRFGPF